ncbi:MAG: aminopeptidase [Actinobacteria bacterium 13_2_20CM_2_72_6]|nr:MAG: aminopeptidase [Actinobacteria bacterium 13_2_20CM_2_72_6]
MGINEDRRARRGGTSRRTLLTASVVTAGVAASAPLGAAPASAADTAAGISATGTSAATQRPDRELRDLLRQVDQRRIEATVRRLAAFGTRHTLSSQDDPVRGIGAARDWILAQFQGIAATSGGRMTVEAQSFIQPVASRIPVPTRITNIVATLRGQSAPNRAYVVSGHYDSRCTDIMNFTSDAPGADDDASGVALVLELARLFATRPTEATVIFTAVAGEEQGLYGSAFQAQQFKAAGLDIQAMFSNDIIGASTAEGARNPHIVRLFADGVPPTETPAQASTRQAVGGENDSPARQLSRFVQDVAQNEDTDMRIRVIYRRDRYLRGSDHISYLQQGYPGLRFTEPVEDFAHEHQDVRVENGKQFGDLVEFCDFGYIARVTRVNGAVLWSLAQAPSTPQNVVIDTSQLTNDTTLRWTRGTEADLAGYEVVYRETTSPAWTNVVAVGDVTSTTLHVSKDNVFFGVRAVDRDGHRSPVAFPRPSG